jgi:ABC-type transport system involved in multi-copper enzyme maturation permease subunit
VFFILLYTAGQTTFGFQDVRGISAMASFGSLTFQILAFVQLSLVLFFSLLFTVGNIAQEKDRQTLILLLMTDLSNREIVLGKLLSSLLQVGTLILASVPVFVFLQFLGGVDVAQVAWAFAVTAASAMLAGCWAAFVAFWREKTFQTLATSVLGLVVYLGLIEVVIAVTSGSIVADVATLLSPYRAMLDIVTPFKNSTVDAPAVVSGLNSVIALSLLSFALIGVAINRLRVWNPSRKLFVQPETVKSDEVDTENGTAAGSGQVVRHRRIWSNPVIWREIKTRAYGRKIIFLKLAYLVVALFVFSQLIFGAAAQGGLVLGMISQQGFAFVALSILGLMLINAQAVTSITSERDGKTIDLLVATDITAKEFVYGKLGGVFFNTKELALIPLAIVFWFFFDAHTSFEDAVYLGSGYLVLVVFAAMLGIHSGLGFTSSRQAIANSMGTIFFLFVGIFVLMILLVETRGSLANQISAFFVFILAGALALVQSLTNRNPSPALRIAGGLLPLLTFYAITSYLLQGTLGVSFSIVAAYGFTSAAMLIPAISEFDVALGRSTGDNRG